MAIQGSFSLFSSNYALKSFSQSLSQSGRAAQAPMNPLSKMQDKALESLAREIPGMESTDLKALDASEYTPDKVAERISGFVAKGLENAKAQGRSDEEVQALYDSAMKGMKQGFGEAKEALDRLGMLNGTVKDQVEATEKSTFDAMAKLDPSRQKEMQPATEASSGASRTVGAAARYARADDFELMLKTRDGDEVRVRFSQDLQAQAGFGYAEDGQGNRAAVMELSRSEKTGYSFSIEGDLSDEEIGAIQALVTDVGGVANDFFGGDVQRAFEQVSDIRFDDTQLASMSLHMSRSEQYSAAQRYQETQQVTDPQQNRHGRRLGHLARDLSDSFQKPGLAFLDQAEKLAGRLMKGLMEQDSRFKDAVSEQQSAYRANMERLLSAVGASSQGWSDSE